jgi:hypothetical protein
MSIMGVALAAVLVCVFLLVSGVLNQPQGKVQSTPTAAATAVPSPTPTPQNNGSALVFGTNLGLFDANDQVLRSSMTRQMMQQLHVKIIRFPTRKAMSNNTIVEVAQYIKNMHAVPLVVLNGARNANYVAYDTAIVNAITPIFGNDPVYYEFGNEDDFNGVTMPRYVQAWNTIMPQIKKIAPNAKLVGPVSYQYSHKNLTEFLQGANPRPDAISWHEYTCSYKDQASDCMAHLDKWTTHINDANSVMQSTVGTKYPIMITEWNYCPDQSIQANGQPFQDDKYNNDQFITDWTTKAIQTLIANHVFASMQYSVTNTALPMISSNETVTTQGTTFKNLYEKMVGNN